jgi:hypothetical protein
MNARKTLHIFLSLAMLASLCLPAADAAARASEVTGAAAVGSQVQPAQPDTGLFRTSIEEVTIVSGQRYNMTLEVPLSTYSGDGSIEVKVMRSDAIIPIVNEIALEEQTQITAASCNVVQTPAWTTAFGFVAVAGQPAPAGSVVTAENTAGEVVGCFVVTQAGQYGFMNIYGAFGGDPGMQDGEIVTFRVNGALAVATPLLAWHDDKSNHQVDLAAGVTQGQAILLSSGWQLFSTYVETPVPTLQTTLQSIAGRYCRVLDETGIYDCTVPSQFQSLRELHGGQGYYIRLKGKASANLLIEGVPMPVDSPIPLHQGWNWIGYLPRETLPTATALKSIQGQYLRVTDGVRTYDPALPQFSNLLFLDPGKGYLLFATTSTSLVYSAGGTSADVMQPDRQQAADLCSGVQPTPFFTILYGDLTVNDSPAPPGARVEAITPRGDVAGCFVVDQAGSYGFMHIYGEDTGSSPVAGFREGEVITLRINGQPATLSATMTWINDRDIHRVDAGAENVLQARIFLPLLLR